MVSCLISTFIRQLLIFLLSSAFQPPPSLPPSLPPSCCLTSTRSCTCTAWSRLARPGMSASVRVRLFPILITGFIHLKDGKRERGVESEQFS